VHTPQHHLLIVDDDRVFRGLLKETLEESKPGCVIHALGSTTEAIAFLRADPPFVGRQRPDLALLDFELDGGTDATGLIRMFRGSQELKTVPVMVLSQRDHSGESIAAGADRFLLKPSELNLLREAVMSFWRQSIEGRPVVLLVEDTEREAKFMREHLEDAFEVRWVKSPDQAMVEMRSGSVDCVVMDYQFEGVIQGPAYVQRIRDSYPAVPIVIVTGYGDEEMTRDALLDLRADDFVAKRGDNWPHKVAQRAKAAHLRASRNLFARDGKVWHIRFDGKEVRVPGTIGFLHLAQLLGCPYQPFTCERLLELLPCDQADIMDASGQHDVDLGTEQVGRDPVMDAKAIRTIKEHLKELEEARRVAEQTGDLEASERIDHEEEAIAKHLKSAFRPGGSTRGLDPERENRRINMRRNVCTAITRIAKEHLPLAEHLLESITFGHQIEYHPKPSNHVSWLVQT
jgi:DNA-binding response OmpR family regulator